jgi:hypothetical protein
MSGRRRFRLPHLAAGGSIVLLGTLAVYWLTCFRTITWWDSSEYALAALTLGVAHPPGSLILTLLGWLVTRVPVGLPPVEVLGFLAGLIAAGTCVLLFRAGLGLECGGDIRIRDSLWPLAGAILMALGIGYGETVWSYATRFTPYGLTALFTILIVWSLLRYWYEAGDTGADRWLLVALLLLGLDFSVHRTNLLLLPGVILWVFLRSPRTLVKWRNWTAGLLAFVAGLAVQLTLIPMARRSPFLNGCDPSSWQGFWDYVSLKMYGGGWLINLYPRKGVFLTEQLADLWHVLRDNLMALDSPLGLLGLVPAALGLYGFVDLWRRQRRLTLALLGLLLFAGLGMVIYLNRPTGFFRSMDRHYLPALMVCAIFVVYGAASILRRVSGGAFPGRRVAPALVCLLVCTYPIGQILRNYRHLDNSRTTFAHDFAVNVMTTLPANAILLTGGDNDTWPLLYLQGGEGMRPDVTVLNIGLLNTPWFVKHVVRHDLQFPLRLTDQEVDALAPVAWTDSTVSIPVDSHFVVLTNQSSPVTEFRVTPSMAWGDRSILLVQDRLLVDLLKQNKWRRPICFMISCPLQGREWLAPYLMSHGLFGQVFPVAPLPSNGETIRTNLLDRYSYRGYADPSVPMDEVSSQMAWNYYSVLLQNLGPLETEEQRRECRSLLVELQHRMPLERIQPPEQLRQAIMQLTGE